VLQDFEAVTRSEDDAELSLSEAQPSQGALVTTFVAFTAWASSQPTARDEACSSAPAICPRSRQHPRFSTYDPVADACGVASERRERWRTLFMVTSWQPSTGYAMAC